MQHTLSSVVGIEKCLFFTHEAIMDRWWEWLLQEPLHILNQAGHFFAGPLTLDSTDWKMQLVSCNCFSSLTYSLLQDIQMYCHFITSNSNHYIRLGDSVKFDQLHKYMHFFFRNWYYTTFCKRYLPFVHNHGKMVQLLAWTIHDKRFSTLKCHINASSKIAQLLT